MTLSPEAKLMSGATLLAVPTILYGGVTLLGVLTEGVRSGYMGDTCVRAHG